MSVIVWAGAPGTVMAGEAFSLVWMCAEAEGVFGHTPAVKPIAASES